MELVLVPMTPEEFERRSAESRKRYAANLHSELGLTADAATAEARRQMDAVLPRGVHTEDAILRTAWVNDTVVGWVWVTRAIRLYESLGFRVTSQHMAKLLRES
ncbi:hypothetical protein EV385_3495 [Krasilnikovia cinnamomea]|uniref:Uncharacterized protein n=1 Tax=Krasilnikovia cinnamomea TaxID=349313 RepID=A0A4Q7ZL29_9ACTN|nr:hypothetical protein [Krasilnikovia cinnamomea]RZU51662.1 hypothetical protein EV385_3495 [Krasilnikovia cinnamomea]